MLSLQQTYRCVGATHHLVVGLKCRTCLAFGSLQIRKCTSALWQHPVHSASNIPHLNARYVCLAYHASESESTAVRQHPMHDHSAWRSRLQDTECGIQSFRVRFNSDGSGQRAAARLGRCASQQWQALGRACSAAWTSPAALCLEPTRAVCARLPRSSPRCTWAVSKHPSLCWKS